MLFTEFDMDTAIEVWKSEGKEEGLKEGLKEGKLQVAKNLLDVLDIETISKKTGLAIDEVKKLI